MKSFLHSILNSYSLLFFSQHRGFAALLLLVSFAHPAAGAAGLGAVLLAVGLSRAGGFDTGLTGLGAYSFNSLLVALALSTLYAPGGPLLALLAVGAGLAWLLSVVLTGWLGGRGLPALSLPFVLTMWLLLATAGTWPGLHLSERGVYWLNEYYDLGGPPLVAAARWVGGWPWPPLLAAYLRALSSVLLQDSPVGGLLVALGLLWHSRISFSLSVLAFLAAYGFAVLTGLGPGAADSYNLGANYVMAAIAVGAVFVVPSASSYLLALLNVPLVAVLLAGLGAVLGRAGLPAFSLPYCLLSLLTLYALLLRPRPARGLRLTPYQRYSPEANLYALLAEPAQPPGPALALPFPGEWEVSQGYEGELTHQGEWGQALDFVVTDADGRSYQGAGRRLSDFYCYNKPVLAPADGEVVTVVDHVDDNPVGQVNTRQNWGNVVVLQHAPGLYTLLAHLRPQSVRVQVGQRVRQGEVLASCGSSGRSPEPHLHFQVQATPAVGARTLAYPLASFLAGVNGHRALRHAAVPATGERVSNPSPDRLLSQALALPPGYALQVQDEAGTATRRWEVLTDAYNQTYLRCAESSAVAYFEHDAASFRFTTFYGDESSWLYLLYRAAYRVSLVGPPAGEVRATLPLTLVKSPLLKWPQDLLAPFFRFLEPAFSLQAAGPATDSRHRLLSSRVKLRGAGRPRLLQEAELEFADGALRALRVRRPGHSPLYLLCTPLA